MCGNYIIDIIRNTWHSIPYYIRNIPLGAYLIDINTLTFFKNSILFIKK
jgi:hypothetical protein